ncbi:hypothetical protein V501_05033 [Pseudogymnoascus sp. VKM F-4519 (FW-2642)]|nr:hypothetical protein V501_05033 [Pseudogymnoascus sp. VKM F-4519 (FW-2642)]
MDNRQSSATFSVPHIPLYPMPNNTAYSVHGQSGLILPSIKDLHLPMTKAVNAWTQTQTELFQEKHSGNPTPLPSYATTTNAATTHAATTHGYKYRSNKPYTPDQIRFIQCKRDDENMPWTRVTEAYNQAFPGYYRSRGGLECRYYREQEPKGSAGSASST